GTFCLERSVCRRISVEKGRESLRLRVGNDVIKSGAVAPASCRQFVGLTFGVTTVISTFLVQVSEDNVAINLARFRSVPHY
ncbi:UNVERIFIED_CONTAM: hypothetical protein GTU68_046744, partial [Idotea baltica]|nr:hypothetical protein [Idotea baltica]